MMGVCRVDGPNFVTLTEAGIVTGRKGVNETSIGFVANGLVTPEDVQNPYRKPYVVRYREILEVERLDKAIEPFIATDRVCSTNFLVGCASGEMINIEIAPEVANYLYPQDGLLTHANHFEDRSEVTVSSRNYSIHALSGATHETAAHTGPWRYRSGHAQTYAS